jgi:hypothetical protein
MYGMIHPFCCLDLLGRASEKEGLKMLYKVV